MRFQAKTALRLLALLCACLLGVSVAGARTPKTSKSAKPSSHKTSVKTSAKKSSHKHSSKTARRSRRPRGQQQIDAERTRQIQDALIRERYLDGESTGDWDSRTRDAMTRYQAAHGWQTKVLPDSRALISLGLGPSQSNLLNPQTAALPRAVTPASAAPVPSLSESGGMRDEPQHR